VQENSKRGNEANQRFIRIADHELAGLETISAQRRLCATREA